MPGCMICRRNWRHVEEGQFSDRVWVHIVGSCTNIGKRRMKGRIVGAEGLRGRTKKHFPG